MTCASKPYKNDVLPFSDESGSIHEHAHTGGDHNIKIRVTEGKDNHRQAPIVDTKTMSGLDVMVKKMRNDEEEEKLRLEWKKLAGDCDRLLLIVFVTIHLFMILLILLALPHT